MELNFKKPILKKYILLIFLLNFGIGIAQTKVPFFEQIAFDFYQTEILPKNPAKNKIRIYKEIQPYKLTETPFWYPRCLEKIEIEEYDNSKHNVSNKTELNLENIDKGDFKIKKYGKGNYPKLYVSQSLTLSENRILVVLKEVEKWSGIYYYIELDKKGKITNWCQGGYIE